MTLLLVHAAAAETKPKLKFGAKVAGPKIPALGPASKSAVPNQIYRCNGTHLSFRCVTQIFANRCKDSIEIRWLPLEIPGTKQWAQAHRNWCSVIWDSQDASEERKFSPERCDRIHQLLSVGLRELPELAWADAKCTNISGSDGFLYASQTSSRSAPIAAKSVATSSPEPDPEPRAIRLADLAACSLENGKKRILRCPVLPQTVHSWLTKLLAELDTYLVIQNPRK